MQSSILLIRIAVPAGIGLLSLTIAIDSIFWQRPLWPEGEVLWFNVILNKSSDYGTSPFLWYIYSALPRAMGTSVILVPIGLFYESRIRAIVVPSIIFVLLYSILPHKELRFIIYVFPLLNIAAACGCHRMWINRGKSIFNIILAFIAGGHLIINVFLTCFLLLISGTNYPGGVAMSRLHRLASHETNVSVHICNLAAQSGVSRFTEINEHWTYSKDEKLKSGNPKFHSFTHLLIEPKSKYALEMKQLQQTHDVLEFVDCFSSIGIQYHSLFPVKIKTKPCVGIMKRKKSLNFHFDDLLKKINIDTKILIEDIDMIDKVFESDEPIQRLRPLEINDDIDLIEEFTTESEEDLKQRRFAKILDTKQIKRILRSVDDMAEDEMKNDNDDNDDDDDNEDSDDNNNNHDDGQQIKSTKNKIKELIESHYRSKGSLIEYDPDIHKMTTVSQSTTAHHQQQSGDERTTTSFSSSSISQSSHSTTGTHSSAKTNIKRIIKAEQIKELVDRILKLDLNKACDLEILSTKDCLKKIIDEYDMEEVDDTLISNISGSSSSSSNSRSSTPEYN